MEDLMEIISQNCLALAIDRCDTAGLPLKNKRQRMVIKGAIRQMLEEEGLVQKFEAVKSLAECQHGNDMLQASVRLHRRRTHALVKRVQDLERLLESLTPGGSEFSGSPEACARWVKERLAGAGKLAAERNRYREQAARLATDVGSMLAEAERYGPDWSVPHFLEDEPTVARLRADLAQMQEANR